MKKIFFKQWTIVTILLLLAALTAGMVYAQAGSGTITVDACVDQNADGDCEDAEDTAAPDGVEACLNDESTCAAVPATFSGLEAGSYTPFLRLNGASQGYYPTTPQTPLTLAEEEQVELELGAVYPVHPKGVAVHAGLNKVYVAFQGPVITEEMTGTVQTADMHTSKPYPFVAVIDGETDEVLQTIPGGPEGIGLEPWGVAVSGDYVYVGAFGEGVISVIDATSDEVVANVKPDRDNFQPTSPDVNPLTGWVHFPDYKGGRVVMISGTEIVAEPLIANQFGFSPFEVAVAKSLQGYNIVSMRDAISENVNDPNPFLLRGVNSAEPFAYEDQAIVLPYGPFSRPSGSPHAVGVWQEEGIDEPRLFLTYADDVRSEPVQPDFINPNKLLVYSFSAVDPKNMLLRNANINVGDYAEVGLVHNPAANHMLGTYAGFPYRDANGDAAACNTDARGGTYAINFDGGVLAGDAPGIWKQPNTIIGNPPLVSDSLQWKNPFEIAINPNNGKVYVTDRCWNDFPEGGQAGGGAVLIFLDEDTGGVEPTPTTEPTAEPTTEPTPEPVVLAFNGPGFANPDDTVAVAVETQGVGDGGVYGLQLEVNYDPAKITLSNSQVNADFPFVVVNTIDNGTGNLRVIASRQGDVPGLTGDVVLVTFEATVAGDASGDTTFTFENEKLGNPEAVAFDLISQSYTLGIGAEPTAEPTEEPTAEPTEEPTAEPTEEPTAEPTEEPTAEPTEEPTAEPTEEPTAEPTEEPTAEPTEEPTAEPTEEPTAEPTEEPTAEPTEEPTAEPTEEPTAEPTEEPGLATVSGELVLLGRAGDDWSEATVVVDDTGQSDTTDTTGQFSIADVIPDTYTSITADAAGYLPAVCTAPDVTAPDTVLAAVTLKSGDVNDDDVVDITDATAVGLDLGSTEPGLATDINRDGGVDILDIILVSISFGEGVQSWDCLATE